MFEKFRARPFRRALCGDGLRYLPQFSLIDRAKMRDLTEIGRSDEIRSLSQLYRSTVFQQRGRELRAEIVTCPGQWMIKVAGKDP